MLEEGYRDGNDQADAYSYAANSRRSGKSAVLGMAYGMGSGLGMDLVYIDETLGQAYGGLKNLQKRDYEKLASAVCDIGKAVEQMFLENPPGRPDAAAIGELVAARIGLALAMDNKKFDSFRWAAACKGEKEE